MKALQTRIREILTRFATTQADDTRPIEAAMNKPNGCMNEHHMTDVDDPPHALFLIRHRNLERVREECDSSTVRLALRLDEPLIHITRFLSLQRYIDDDTARRYEVKLDKSVGWMDRDHDATNSQRYRNLLLLIAEIGSTIELRNKVCGQDGDIDPAVSDAFMEAVRSKVISDDLARLLEISTDMPEGWTDQPHLTVSESRKGKALSND